MHHILIAIISAEHFEIYTCLLAYVDQFAFAPMAYIWTCMKAIMGGNQKCTCSIRHVSPRITLRHIQSFRIVLQAFGAMLNQNHASNDQATFYYI